MGPTGMGGDTGAGRALPLVFLAISAVIAPTPGFRRRLLSTLAAGTGILRARSVVGRSVMLRLSVRVLPRNARRYLDHVLPDSQSQCDERFAEATNVARNRLSVSPRRRRAPRSSAAGEGGSQLWLLVACRVLASSGSSRLRFR